MAPRGMQWAGQTPDFVADAVGLMREHLAANLTVADLADHVGYSRYHFSRMFARITGLAPMEYCAALRFAEAKRLLLITDEPVVDVCAQVGFASLSTFSRRFHHAVGTAPAGLRRLADDVAERPVAPFAVGDPGQPSVLVHLDLGEGLLRTALVRGAAEEDMGMGAPATDLLAGLGRYQDLRMPRQTWIGWYPRPVPVGLPAAGALVGGADQLELPTCPGNPWLLAVSMPADADPLEQLAPSVPLVAGHPAPITPATLRSEVPPEIVLRFAPADLHNVPLLSALARLRD